MPPRIRVPSKAVHSSSAQPLRPYVCPQCRYGYASLATTPAPPISISPSISQPPPIADLSMFHQPGQIMHTNQEVQGGTWTHGLCDCSNIGTCCLGIICPCILYGKTQHRLSMKSRKEDPTNMLGYDTCNGSCTAMALLCGCQCKLSMAFILNLLLTPNYRASGYHPAHEDEKSVWN